MDSNYQQQLWVKRNQKLDKLKAIKIPEQKKELEEENESMDTTLCELATKDNADIFLEELQHISGKQISLITIINQVTFTGNTLLHVAAASGSKDITQLLAYHFPDNLITKTNFQGDTALHAAARAGELATAMILIDVAKNYGGFLDKDLLEMKNEKGNTALHEAVCNDHIEVAKYVVSIEPLLAYCRNLEGVKVKENMCEGRSPLYIAAQAGKTQIFDILLQAIAQDHLALQRLQGKSPAHAAIEKKNLEILEELAEKKPELLRAKERGGNNALHLASNMGYVQGVKFLLNNSFECAIERNKEGLYPIHVACRKGYTEVIEELINGVKSHEPMEFLTEKERQNILHVAASHGRERTVRFIVGKGDKLKKMLNQKDINGNTPLHLAAMHARPATTFALLKNKDELDFTIVNNQNLTPYGESLKRTNQLMPIMDEEEDQDPKPTNQINNKQENQMENRQSNEFKEDIIGMMTFAVLFWHGRPKEQGIEYLQTYLERKAPSEKELSKRVEVLLVAAVLVAGMAFGGVTQVPQGGNDKFNFFKIDPSSVFISVLYQLYFIFISISLFLSVYASSVLCWVQIYDVTSSAYAVRLASILLGTSFYFMTIAFSIAVVIDANLFPVIVLLTLIGTGLFCTVFTLFYCALLCRATSPLVYYLLFWEYFIVKLAFRFICRKFHLPPNTIYLFTCLIFQKVRN